MKGQHMHSTGLFTDIPIVNQLIQPLDVNKEHVDKTEMYSMGGDCHAGFYGLRRGGHEVDILQIHNSVEYPL